MNPDLEMFLQAWTGGGQVPDAERERLLRRFEDDAIFRGECVAEIRMLGMLRAVQSPPPRWLAINDALGLSASTIESPEPADLPRAVMDRVRGEAASAGHLRGLLRRPVAAAASAGRGKSPPDVFPRTKTAGFPGSFAAAIASLRSSRPFFHGLLGILVGTLCTSAVLGFVTRPAGRAMTLVREGFEEPPAPGVTGVPAGPGQWSGDYSEVVGVEQGVKPAGGGRMLRFLRSDHEGSTGPRPRRSGDVMRVVDVSRLAHDIDRGAVMVSLSALFDAVDFPVDERYDGVVTIYALDADLELDGATEDIVHQEALAATSGDVKCLDRDPATWQPASGKLLLPPGTARVLLKVSLQRMPVDRRGLDSLPEKVSFSGHFIDDVQASLVITEPQPATKRRPRP